MDTDYTTAYLRFHRQGSSPSGKTSILSIFSVMHGDKLGEIRWMGRWRQYAFYPEPDTIWNPACLKDVTDQINELMTERWNK